MKLSKVVAAHSKTCIALWCKRDFMPMSQGYRDVRAKTRNPMTSCYWCKRALLDCEMISLACFVGKGNKVLCQDCAEQLIASENEGVA